VVDQIKNGNIQLVINTTIGARSVSESYSIRRTALTHNLPYYTTVAGAKAAAEAIEALQGGKITVRTIQEYHQGIK